MARIRTIKPSFWNDEKIGELSHFERLLYIGSWNIADDEGLLQASPVYLKGTIFPYDDVTIDQVREAIANLEKAGLWYVYGQHGVRYAWIVMFRTHQRIDKPQRPMYPGPNIQNQAFREAIFRRDKWMCHICEEECAEFQFMGKATDPRVASIDHLIPKSKGGSNYPSNLATACVSCNKGRGNKDLVEFSEDSENFLGTFLPDRKWNGEDNIGIGDDKNGQPPPDEIPYETILLDFNTKANMNCRLSKPTKAAIHARWEDGFRLEDFLHVHTVKCQDWLNDPAMRKHLHPDTLYRPSKFEKYVNQELKPKETDWSPPND